MLSVLLCGPSERTRVAEAGRGRTGLPIKTLEWLYWLLNFNTLHLYSQSITLWRANWTILLPSKSQMVILEWIYGNFTICTPTVQTINLDWIVVKVNRRAHKVFSICLALLSRDTPGQETWLLNIIGALSAQMVFKGQFGPGAPPGNYLQKILAVCIQMMKSTHKVHFNKRLGCGIEQQYNDYNSFGMNVIMLKFDFLKNLFIYFLIWNRLHRVWINPAMCEAVVTASPLTCVVSWLSLRVCMWTVGS